MVWPSILNSWLWAIACVTVLSRVAGTDVEDQPLANWLYDLQVPLGNGTGLLGNVSCSHIIINGLSSSRPSERDVLAVSVSSLQLTCLGHHQADRASSIAFSADVTATLRLEVTVTPNNEGFPSTFMIKPVHFHASVHHVQTGEPLESKVAQLIADALADLVGVAAHFKLEQLGHKLSKRFKTIEPKLARLAKPPKRATPPPIPPGTASLTNPDNDPIAALSFISQTVNATLDGLIESAKGVRNDSISLDLRRVFQFDLPGLSVDLHLAFATLNNIDHWTNIDLVHVSNTSQLTPTLSFRDVNVSLHWVLNVTSLHSGAVLREHGAFHMGIEQAEITADLSLAMSKQRLSHTSLPELSAECLASSIEVANLSYLLPKFESPTFDFDIKTGSLEEQFATLINDIVLEVIHAFGLHEGSSALTAILTGAASLDGRDDVNNKLAKLIQHNSSVNPCTAKQVPGGGITQQLGLLIILGFLGAGAFLCALIGLCGTRLFDGAPCMHPRLGVITRCTPVLVNSLCIGLALAGQLMVLKHATIFLEWDHNGDMSRVIKTQTFSKSLQAEIDARVWYLVFLLLFGAGIMPHVVSVFGIVCWVLPARWLGPTRRERFMSIVCMLCKAPFVQFFLGATLVIALNVHFHIPGVTIHAYTENQAGSQLQFTMALLVLTSNLLSLNLYRKAQCTKQLRDSPNWSLHLSRQGFPLLGKQRHVPWPLTSAPLIGVVLFSALTLSLFLPALRFSYAGAIVVVTSYLEEASVEQVSVFNIISRFFTRMPPNKPPLGFAVQAILILACLIVPVLLLCLGLKMWHSPPSANWMERRRNYAVLEALFCCSGLELAAFGGIVASLQVHQLLGQTFQQVCKGINEFLAANFAQQLKGDAKCIDVDVALLPGAYMTLITSVALIMFARLVLRSAKQSAFPPEAFAETFAYKELPVLINEVDA